MTLIAECRKNMIKDSDEHGFTLIELMIVIVISAIIALCAYASYSVQSKSFSTQRQVSKIQQDLRGALYMMEFDVLNACRDPNLTNRYGITDIRHYGFNAGQLDNIMPPSAFIPPAAPTSVYFASYPVLEFASLRQDSDLNGEGEAPMLIRYQVYDFENDGRLDLGRRVAFGAPGSVNVALPPDLVAEGVIAVGYAFAYNENPDGKYMTARTAPAGPGFLGNVIWAVDSDGDNRLDTNIDITGDGEVTLADDANADGVIDSNDGGALPAQVDIQDAVAVRIWILMQSELQSPENVIDRNQYVVGDRIIPPNGAGFQDRFKRRLKTVTVALRNYRKS